MKPINSKERSKQVWQFVFIFFGLALIPVALIFFSYYHVPEQISKEEDQKLVNYSNFMHRQKVILKKMAEIDSNINKLATAKTESTDMLRADIVAGIRELRAMDSMILVQQASKSYEHDFDHVTSLIKAQNELAIAAAELKKSKEELEAAKRNVPMLGPPMSMVQ